jgi:hypothetical protein
MQIFISDYTVNTGLEAMKDQLAIEERILPSLVWQLFPTAKAVFDADDDLDDVAV